MTMDDASLAQELDVSPERVRQGLETLLARGLIEVSPTLSADIAREGVERG